MVTKDPQPGLELLLEFVNTHDLEAEADELAEPRQLAAWLAARGLSPAEAPVSKGAHAAALAVREAIRVLALANNDEGVETGAAAAVLDSAARQARLALRFGRDGSAVLEPEARGVAGALGRIVAIVGSVSGSEEWGRLKACRSRSCQWVFYDSARNRSRAWCSMRTCGNREKARGFRERHAQ